MEVVYKELRDKLPEEIVQMIIKIWIKNEISDRDVKNNDEYLMMLELGLSRKEMLKLLWSKKINYNI